VNGLRATVIALAALVSTGCTTVVTVRPVTPTSTPTGVRYSLPKPVLHVTPNDDGTVTVDVLFLPDPDKTYAIDSSTFLAAHSLDVMVSKGLLTKVGAIGDSTAVAADLVRAAGTVRADVGKQQGDALSAKQSTVATAQGALDTAESTLAAEEAKLATMIAQGATDLASQQQTVAEKRAARDAARDVLAREQRRSATGIPAAGTFTASTTGSGITLQTIEPDTTTPAPILAKNISGAGRKTVWGARAYTVEEGFVGSPKQPVPAIALREMQFQEPDIKIAPLPQKEFATVTLGTTTSVPRQDKTGEVVVALDDKQFTGSFSLKTTTPISKLGEPPYKIQPATSPVAPAVSLEDGGTTVKVDVSRMASGTYTLTIPFQWVTGKGGLDTADWLVRFRVVVPR
jgi:hypothetical protein